MMPVNMYLQTLVLLLAALCAHSLPFENSNRKTVSYIIKGEEANITDFPYLVFIAYPGNVCTGSLISSEWVVTAGHCVDLSFLPGAHGLRLGSNRIDKGGVRRWGLSIFRHGSYVNFGDPKNDIALIKIMPVRFTKAISPVVLPRQNQGFSTQSMAQIAGFGKLLNERMENEVSTFLMKAKVPYVDTEACRDLMWERAIMQVNPDLEVCFGDLNGGSNICNGDSGGPLIVGNVLVGISSWGIPGECGEPNSPAVFVRVASYRDWITQISGI